RMATSGTSATAPKERTSPTPSSEGPMTHTLTSLRRLPATAVRRAGCVLAAPAARRQVPTHPPPVVRAWTSAVEDDSTDPGFGCELSHVARVATAAWPRPAGGPSRPGVRGGVGGEKDADRSVGQAV